MENLLLLGVSVLKHITVVDSWYLKVEAYPKLLISQSKYTGPSEISIVWDKKSWKENKNRKCV